MCMFFLVYWPLQKQDGHYQPIKILRTLKASFSRRKRLDELKVDYYKTGGYISGKWTQNDIKEEFSDLSFDVTSKIYANGRIATGFSTPLVRTFRD